MDVTLTQDCMQINLPEEMILKIFGLLSYEDVAKVRLVCKQMNIIACSHLNSGFNAAEDNLSKTIKQVKDGLPRRESERRKHPLYPKHDALIGLDTRLSLLRMTYSKYIMAGMTCFIPGRVLDEFFLVLKKIKTLSQLPSTCKLLQEMRDISSMAMEHFDEVISPKFQKSLNADFSSSFRNNYIMEINDFWHKSQVKVPQKTHNSSFKKLSWKVGKCRSLQNRSTLSMKKVVSKQRAELQQLKSMMSKKNKQVQNLKSTVSTQEKTLKEVHSQVVELRTQMQALWSLLSSASPEILLTKLCPKCSLFMRPSEGAKPPMNNAMETTSSWLSAKDPENTANDVLPCLRNASHNLKRKLHNSDPKDAASNSKCTKLL